MVQTAGRVNVVVKSGYGFDQYDGTYTLGDGATPYDVTPHTAAELAKEGLIVAASDVKHLSSDFTDTVTSLQTKNRG